MVLVDWDRTIPIDGRRFLRDSSKTWILRIVSAASDLFLGSAWYCAEWIPGELRALFCDDSIGFNLAYIILRLSRMAREYSIEC